MKVVKLKIENLSAASGLPRNLKTQNAHSCFLNITIYGKK